MPTYLFALISKFSALKIPKTAYKQTSAL